MVPDTQTLLNLYLVNEWINEESHRKQSNCILCLPIQSRTDNWILFLLHYCYYHRNSCRLLSCLLIANTIGHLNTLSHLIFTSNITPPALQMRKLGLRETKLFAKGFQSPLRQGLDFLTWFTISSFFLAQTSNWCYILSVRIVAYGSLPYLFFHLRSPGRKCRAITITLRYQLLLFFFFTVFQYAVLLLQNHKW